MHNVWLIARREYLERIRTKAFLVATILIPLLFGGLGFGSSWLASKTKNSGRIAVLSDNSVFAADLKHELESGKNSNMSVVLEPNDAITRSQLDRDLKNSKSGLSGYLQVTRPTQSGARPHFTYKPRSASDIGTANAITSGIRAVLTRERLTSQGMAASEIDAMMAPIQMDTSETGDTTTAFFAAYVLFFLMYMVIMLYGMNTARSIIEEKSSRVFEVLLATIKPQEMLAGKIIGVGAVGLTQIGIWMLAAAAVGTYFAASLGGVHGHGLVSPTQIFFFVAYFLFGFMIYSSIAAALGAMTNSEQELQQLNLFLVLPLAFCMLMLVSIIKNPDSPLSRVASLIPFCSPLLMNFRISIGNPQPWEIALSFVLMSLTIVIILFIASRIYRVGVLMYGKKPNLPEIIRWLRYT